MVVTILFGLLGLQLTAIDFWESNQENEMHSMKTGDKMSKRVLVFGGSGFVGKELVRRLAQKGYKIISASRQAREENLANVTCVTNEELFSQRLDVSDVECAVVCAFARESAFDKLAQSLRFTDEVMHFVLDSGIKCAINLSSQSVYAQNSEADYIDETAEIGPADGYGVAKFATELLANNIWGGNINFTNIRLASVNMQQRFTRYFIESAIQGKKINVYCDAQTFSLIDVSDVAEALTALIDCRNTSWDAVYNLGAGYVSTTLEAARTVRDIAVSQYHLPPIDIEIGSSPRKPFSAVSNNRLTALTGWKPQISLHMLLEKMFAQMIDATR